MLNSWCWAITGLFGFCFTRYQGGASVAAALHGVGAYGIGGCWPGWVRQERYPAYYGPPSCKPNDQLMEWLEFGQ